MGVCSPAPTSLSLSLWLFLPERAEVGVATLLSGGQQQSDLIQPPRPRKPPMRAVNAGVVTAQHSTEECGSAGGERTRGGGGGCGLLLQTEAQAVGAGESGSSRSGAARLLRLDGGRWGRFYYYVFTVPRLHVGDLSALN